MSVILHTNSLFSAIQLSWNRNYLSLSHLCRLNQHGSIVQRHFLRLLTWRSSIDFVARFPVCHFLSIHSAMKNPFSVRYNRFTKFIYIFSYHHIEYLSLGRFSVYVCAGELIILYYRKHIHLYICAYMCAERL